MFVCAQLLSSVIVCIPPSAMEGVVVLSKVIIANTKSTHILTSKKMATISKFIKAGKEKIAKQKLRKAKSPSIKNFVTA